MPEKLRVGIIGAGWAAESHAAAFLQLPNVEVTALWSRKRTTAEALAGRLKQSVLRIYDDWQDLIEESKVDVISIATPPMLHRAPAVAALEQGYHVLVEKPISIDVADARAMVHAAQGAKTVTATCFNWRYTPAIQVALRAVLDGQIGAIRDVRSHWHFRMTTRDFAAARPWIARMDIANGALGEGLSHDFDKARFLTGSEFKQIVSRITPMTIKQDGDYLLDGGRSLHLVAFENGALGDFFITPTAGENDWHFLLLGDEGSLAVTHAGEKVSCQRATDDEPQVLAIPESDQVPPGVAVIQHTWNRLIAEFIHAIRRGDSGHQTVPHLPSLLDGLRTEEIIAAARESDTRGEWVSVGE
jgi:predicted dehydrogenase